MTALGLLSLIAVIAEFFHVLIRIIPSLDAGQTDASSAIESDQIYPQRTLF